METTEHSDVTLAFLVSQGFSSTILERFWAKVEKSQEPDGCWIWKGTHNGKGYGKIGKRGHNLQAYAHRVSWLIANGAIPDGLEVLHNCPTGDNPKCVNPAHLFLGTHQENFDDCVKKGRTHKGYKLTDEQVLEIIRLRPTTSGKELAARFGVSMVLISQIVHGQRYPHLLARSGVTLPLTVTDQRKNLANYKIRKNQYS